MPPPERLTNGARLPRTNLVLVVDTCAAYWARTRQTTRLPGWIGRCAPYSPIAMRRIRTTGAWALLLLAWWSGALAQTLPVHVPLPSTPLPTGELVRGVDGVLRAAPDQALREVRRLRVRELLRVNRQVLEADPRGAPILRNEV